MPPTGIYDIMKSAISVEVRQEILAKVKLGEKVTALATQYGVSDKTIYLSKIYIDRLTWGIHQ